MIIKNKIEAKKVFYKLMSTRNEISQNEAIRLIAEATGQSHQRIFRSYFQQSGFYNDGQFLKDFAYYNKKGIRMFIWRNYAIHNDIPIMRDIVEYNNPEKQKAREMVFKSVPLISYPRIVTNANRNGYDVSYIMSLNPNSFVYNVELYKHVLDDYKQRCEFPKKVLHHEMSINAFIKKQIKNQNHFDIMFYDCHSYISDTMIEDLELINKHQLTDEISITLTGIGNYPGVGNRVKALKSQYKHFGDQQQLMMLYHLLSKYTCVDCIIYHGCYNCNQQGRMIVYKFKINN